MIVIKVMGGLGNQMFQYALYKKFKSLGVEVYLDDEQLRQYGNQHNGLELVRAFNLEYERPKAGVADCMADRKMDLINRARRHFFGKRNNELYFNEQDLLFKDYLLSWNNKYLEGYWQSERYFLDIREALIKDFCFTDCHDVENDKVLKAIISSNSVSIHVRRGDYLNADNENFLGGVCSEDYYSRAIDMIKSKNNDATFFVFSDDIEWVKKSFFMDFGVTLVDVNHGSDSYKDMFLISKCKHNIIANSTFSWWGAWLNENDSKTVIMPKQWYKDETETNIYCDSWVRI